MNTYMPVKAMPIENSTRTVNQKLRRPLHKHTPHQCSFGRCDRTSLMLPAGK